MKILFWKEKNHTEHIRNSENDLLKMFEKGDLLYCNMYKFDFETEVGIKSELAFFDKFRYN